MEYYETPAAPPTVETSSLKMDLYRRDFTINTLAVNARERLLETATELFAEKGYASTSVREIVARAGVSKPVLYYYFQSKEGLYYALLKWGTEVQQKIIEDVFQVSGTVQDRIIFLYRRIYEEIQEYQGLYTMIHGKDKKSCVDIAKKISEKTSVETYQLLFSEKELKKTSMKYFE